MMRANPGPLADANPPITHWKPSPPRASGFTLVELLVGSVLVLIAAAGAAFVVSSGSNMLRRGRTADRQQALIDADIAQVRELSSRFTCCSGVCGINNAGCLDGPGSDLFYYPDTTAIPSGFLEGTGLCINGGIGNVFAAAVGTNAPTSAEFGTVGLVREPPLRVGSLTNDGRNHLVRLVYLDTNRNNQILRVVNILPPAASWCP